jgi:hypothetical protein
VSDTSLSVPSAHSSGSRRVGSSVASTVAATATRRTQPNGFFSHRPVDAHHRHRQLVAEALRFAGRRERLNMLRGGVQEADRRHLPTLTGDAIDGGSFT